MEGNNGELTNMNNNNNTQTERRGMTDPAPLTRRLGSGRAGSGGRLDDASWIQTRESRSRDPGLLHTLQRDKLTPKRLSTGSDDSGWIKATPSSATRRSTGSDDLWLRSPQRIRRVTTDSWSSSGSGSGASGAAAGATSEAGSGAARSSASGASSGAASSVVNRWNASILEPGKLRIKAEDAKSWIKSDIKDARSGSGRIQHNPEPVRAIHTPELALRSTDTQPVREAKLRPSDMGDVKLRLQSFEQGFLQSDSAVRTRERSRDRDRSRDHETQIKAKEENFTPRTEILKSAIAKFDMVSSSNKNSNKPETDEDTNRKYERRLRTVRTHRNREEDVGGDNKDGLKAAEDGNQGQTDRSRDDQGAIRKEDVTVITGVNQGDPNNGEIENISVPHERSNPTAARETQEEGVVSTLEGTSRIGRRRRRHDPPTEREERMPIKEARMRGHDGKGIEVDGSIKRQEAALTVTDSSTVTHQEATVKGVDTVTVTDSITTIENTDSMVTPTQSDLTSRQDGGTIETGSAVKEVQITQEKDLQNKENDFVPTEETYTAQGSITLSSVSPTTHHTDTVTLRNREAAKEVKLTSNDEGDKVGRLEETGSMGEDKKEDEAAVEDNGIEENKTTKDTDVQIVIESTTTTSESGKRGRYTEDGAYSDQGDHTEGERSTCEGEIRNVKVIETKTEDYKAELIETELKEEEVHNKEESTRTEDEAPRGDSTTKTDVGQGQEDEVIVTEVTYISHHTEGEVHSARGEDDMVTETIHIQSNVTTDIENTVTNDIEISVTNDIENNVTNDIKIGVTNDIESSVTNDLEDVSEIKEETLQATTVGLTQSAPRSDTIETDSEVQDSALETELIVIEAHSEGAGEIKDTIQHTYTDTQTTSTQSGGIQAEEVIHVSDDKRGVTSDNGDQNESVSSIVTEDIKYVTDDSDNNEETTEKESTQTTITVSQQVVQGENLHDISEESPSVKKKDVIHAQVLEETIQREVIDEVIEPQAQDILSKGEVSASDTGAIQEPSEVDVNKEEQGPRASDNETSLCNEDLTLVEETKAQQNSQKQEEVMPTEEECDSYKEPTESRDTMITTETIQLKYDSKTEDESAIKIIVTQVKDIRGQGEVEIDKASDVECRETEKVITVRESVDGLNDEENNDFNSVKMTHTGTSAERLAGSESSGSADIISLAQGEVDMTSAGECGDETESEVTRRVENEPNGVYRDHYHVGGESEDNTYRAGEVRTWQETSKPTQAEQSIQIPTHNQSIEITNESRTIDMSSGNLKIGAEQDQDSADPTDEKSLSYLCEDYVYVDTPPAHSDTEEEQGDDQIGHGFRSSPGSFGSQHKMERAGFDVNEDDDTSTEQGPEAGNVQNSLVGSTQKHTQPERRDTQEHTEHDVEEDELASSQDYNPTHPEDPIDNTTDNPTHPEHPIDNHAKYAEDDRALLSQGYTRLEEEDDDNTITQVIYMDDVEIPSDDDSNSEGGEYAENDTEEEMLDSDEQEDTESGGSSERIEYPWGVERAWGLETIQERPEGFDSDGEEEKRAPLAQMESSDDDGEWMEEYTFIQHEPEEPQPERCEEQGGDESEEIPLITTDAESQVDTEEDNLATENIPEESDEESHHKMEYIDESVREGIIQEEDIHREKHQVHSETATSEGIEEEPIKEGLTWKNDDDDIIPQLSKSLSSEKETTENSNKDLKPSEEDQDLDEEEDHDAVDGSVSSNLHLMKNVNTREETESSENEAIKAEIEISLTTQTEQDSNNNQTSGDIVKSEDEGVTKVTEVMSLAVLSEAILSLHSSPQETTETADIEEAPVNEIQSDSQSDQDDISSKSTDESVTAIAEAISSTALSEGILSLPREKPTQEENDFEDIKETQASLSEARIVEVYETSHGGISEKSDGADNMPGETAEAVSDMIISEASISLQSSPIVEDGTADDNVSSADSEKDSDSDNEESSESDSQRPATVNDATLGVIAEYMSCEVMSEVLVSLQSRLEELEDEESEAMESHSVGTEIVVCEQCYQHEGVGGATYEKPDELSTGTVDNGLVEAIAEGMSLTVITETMATLKQTVTEDSMEKADEDSNTLNDTRTTENILDDKLHSEPPSDHHHTPHEEDQAPDVDSSEAREINVESLDTSTHEADQEAPVAAATSEVVDTVEISKTFTVSKEAEVISVTDLPTSAESTRRDAVNVGNQVHEISETVQDDIIAHSSETESTKIYADNVNEGVQEISKTVQEDIVAPSSETESCNDDQTSVVLSVDSVTMVTSEVNSEGQTKDSVQSTSVVSPSKTDTGPNDERSGESLINDTVVKVAHSDSSDQDSVVKTPVEITESQPVTKTVSDVKSKTAAKVVSVEESTTSKVHIKDIKIQPELSRRERTRLIRETRSRLSRTVTNKEQERAEDTARYRRPRKPPPTEEQIQMKQLVTWLSSSPSRTGDTKHKMLNGDEDICYDTLILEVFEESDTIFFPLVQQKEARAFIKALHMKGVAYEALCQEVGEHEHNFTSWRKSLGRAGIGHAVMQWANRPLQDLLDDEEEEEEDEDDGMDDADIQAEQDRKIEEERLREEEGQRRLQGSIETDKVKKEVDHNRNDQKDAHDQNNSSAAKSNGVTMRRPKETSPPPTETKTAKDGKPPRQKYEQEPDLIRLRRLEEFKKTQEKDDAEPVQDIRKRISLFEKQQSPSKSGSESREESENGEPEEESRTETESISSGSMDEPTESSPEPPSEPRPKSPEPPVLVEEVITVQQEAVIEEAPHYAISNGRSTREATPKDTSPPPLPAEDNKPKDQTDSSGSSLPDVSENYNSDLDPDNDMHSPVQAIAAKKIASSRINKTWSGFIFVFSDTPANSETCRVKVGASAFPHKRLRQAQLFNPDMYQVHTVAVKQRSAALEQVLAELDPYRLSGQKDWFEGPFNDLIAAISDVAARFPSSRKIIDNNADDGDGESAC